MAETFSLSEAERKELEQYRCAHETKVLTIFFSDLVGSTKLQVDLGNREAARLVRYHYSILRKALASFDGKEISTAGDSMLIVFPAPADAIKFALTIQQAIRREQARELSLPTVRCGIHHGQVVLQSEAGETDFNDIYGVQVSTAARIMSLGTGEQILMSRAVFDDARTVLAHDDLVGFGEISWLSHGFYRFKGIPEQFEICEVGEVSFAPMLAPADSGKALSMKLHAELSSNQSRLTGSNSPTGGIYKGRLIAVGFAIIITTLAAIFIFQGLSQSPTADSGAAAEIETRAKRLSQIETLLIGLANIDDDLKAMETLDNEYRKATNVIFGGEPSQVRNDALRFLARLRTYDLNDEERALVSKADAMASQTINFYPEEVYNPIRELAERLSSRRKALLREKEYLNQSQP